MYFIDNFRCAQYFDGYPVDYFPPCDGGRATMDTSTGDLTFHDAVFNMTGTYMYDYAPYDENKDNLDVQIQLTINRMLSIHQIKSF